VHRDRRQLVARNCRLLAWFILISVTANLLLQTPLVSWAEWGEKCVFDILQVLWNCNPTYLMSLMCT